MPIRLEFCDILSFVICEVSRDPRLLVIEREVVRKGCLEYNGSKGVEGDSVLNDFETMGLWRSHGTARGS